MKKIYLGLLFVLLLKTGLCQNQKIDSLRVVYNNKTKPDSVRLKALHAIVWSYCYTNPDSANILVKQELQFAQKTNQKKWQANAFNLMGILLMNTGTYPQALDYYFKAAKLFEESGVKKGIGNCYNNIGLIYLYQSDYIKALDYYLKALKIREEIKDTNGIAYCYNNIGIVYRKQASYNKAFEYYTKGLKLNEEIGDKRGVATCYNNIGLTYQDKKDYSNALDYYFKALKIREESGEKKNIGDSYVDIANVYNLQYNYTKALDYYLKCLKVKEEIKDKEGIGNCYGDMADLFNKLSDFRQAIYYSQLAIKTDKEIGYMEGERHAYASLSNANYKTGNYKEAYENYVKFKQLTDSIFNADNSKQLSDMKIKFEVEKKETELKMKAEAEQEKLKTIAAEEIKRQKLINWSISILFGLVILSSLLLFNRVRLKQKNKHQQLINEQQKELAVAVMDTQEQERKRIAEDLHDSLGHLLSTVKLNLQNLPESQKQSVENSIGLLNQASDEMQNITFNLMPRTLEEEGLIAALNELATKVNYTGAVKIKVNVHDMNRFNLEKQSQFNIYRIVQEAVNNILKHAEAKEINIQLIGQDNHFTIMIEDDGKGFDTGIQKNGRGLKNIVTRSLWLNGNINIDSTPGRGTTITTEIPG
jgi:two-component system NarL family sensor kinase